MASIPRTEAVFAPHHPELRAHGLINNSVAPAWPALSLLPA